uniref:Uncharacterized protein n=1 Tax=Cacopsylla melanoneura TaxID=428564 RepID=A0A8D9E753_9HEMI
MLDLPSSRSKFNVGSLTKPLSFSLSKFMISPSPYSSARLVFLLSLPLFHLLVHLLVRYFWFTSSVPSPCSSPRTVFLVSLPLFHLLLLLPILFIFSSRLSS